jgi:hypothetical protein
VAVLTVVFMALAPLRGERVSDFVVPLPIVVVCVIGGLVAAKRPGNATGWLLLAMATTLIAQGFAQRYARYAYLGHHKIPLARLAAWFGAWSFIPAIGALGLVFMLFPSGRALSKRWRPIVIGAVLILAAVPILALPSIADPGRVLLLAPSVAEVPHAGGLAVLSGPGIMAVVAAGALTLVVRWFRSRGVERQQMKWFAFGAVILIASFAFIFLVSSALHTDDPVDTVPGALAQFVGFSSIAVAIGVAVLRHRVYDIDRIISRTATYAVVTALIAALYVLVVLVPTTFVAHGHTPPWLVAVGTIVAAAAFRPVRRRVQNAIDHRFNRRRYDAAQTIETFAGRLRDEVDIDEVANDLAAVVHRTMAPAHVSVWIKDRPT